MGALTDTLRSTLRELAESDARLYRGLAKELGTTPTRRALSATHAELDAAAALLRAHGYRVTPPRR